MELHHDCRFAGSSRITVIKVGIIKKLFLCPSFQLDKCPKLSDCFNQWQIITSFCDVTEANFVISKLVEGYWLLKE